MREARLRWYNHALLGKEDSVRKTVLKIEKSGKQSRGRSKQCCSEALRADMKAASIRDDHANDR